MTLRYGMMGAVAILLAMTATTTSAETEYSGKKCPLPKNFIEQANQGKFVGKNADKKFGSSAVDCDFHQWSWAMFLSLTQQAGDGKLRFETMPTPASVLNPGSNAGAGPKTSVLNPRFGKEDYGGQGVHDYDSVDQAGSHEMLVDRQGHAVYYSQRANETFKEFVEKNGLDSEKGLKEFARNNPKKNFPNGALELKASWKIVSQHPTIDPTKFYTQKAEITRLKQKYKDKRKKKKNGLKPDPGNRQKVTLALVGLHVVGRVPNHPEFVWATFEHRRNAPSNKSACSGDGAYTFFDPQSHQACNQGVKHRIVEPGGGAKAQRIAPKTQVVRRYEFGGGTNANKNAIRQLNGRFRHFLGNSSQFDEVWRNYKLVGAVWFHSDRKLRPGQSGHESVHKLSTGSTRLMNATMETFTQSTPGPKNKKSCFSCHNSDDHHKQGLPGANVNLSHMLIGQVFGD